MPFTQAELDSILTASLDYYIDRGQVHDQSIQDKPLLSVVQRKRKPYASGNYGLSVGIRGAFGNPTSPGTDDGFAGYTHDESVNFYTPANLLRARYEWCEHHMGMTLTHTELKIDGISVVDTNGESTTTHSGREKTVLKGLLDAKLEDFEEQRQRSLNKLLWDDGTTDSSALDGIRAFILENPTAGTVGGIDASLADNWWWRNRAKTAAHATATGNASDGVVTWSPANGGALIQTLQEEFRQLRRYGGRPDTWLCGSGFLRALEIEARANGYYSMTGFSGGVNGQVGNISVGGMTPTWDPSLDDLGLQNRAYIFSSDDLCLYYMQGEWMKKHTPARPHEKFVMYRSLTTTAQMVCKRRNSSLVIDTTTDPAP